MPVDTSAINTILNSYLQGRAIRERGIAEQTRMQEREEDIKRAEMHYKDQQEMAKKQFDMQQLQADLAFQKLIKENYIESGGAMLPPGAQLQGTQFEDLQQGDIQDQPIFRAYKIKGPSGEQQIQLPDISYIQKLAERQKAGETEAQEAVKAKYEREKFIREGNLELEKQRFDRETKMLELENELEKVRIQNEGKAATAKKPLTGLTKGAILNPEILKELTPTQKGEVYNEIFENDLQWTPPVVNSSKSLLADAKQSIDDIKRSGGFEGFLGGALKNVYGTETLDKQNLIDALKSNLTIPRLEYMHGLGHMSDNDLKVIQGNLKTLDISSPKFKERLLQIEEAVDRSIKTLNDRTKNTPQSPSGGKKDSKGRRPLSEIIPQ